MTREPYSITPTESASKAREQMRRHSIRHLPVLEGTRLVGVVSDRDLELVEGVEGVELARVRIARLMRPPLEVWTEMPLDEVSELMADHKSDCVVVRGGHGVEGIFTAVDALAALSELLRRATE